MKVLFILHSHSCGGAEKHVLNLMCELKTCGHMPFLACPRDSWLAEQSTIKGIHTVYTAMHGFYDIVSLMQICLFIRKEKIGLLHGHLTRGAFYAGWASRLTGIPSVATAHSTNTWKHFSHQRRIIAVSSAVKESLIARKLDAKRILIIKNGIPGPPAEITDLRSRTRSKLGLSNNDFALGMTARYIRDKGQDILVEAVSRISSEKRKSMKVFFIGEARGEWFKQIRDLVNAKKLADCCHFLGQREDVPQLLGAMDIFVLPSRREAISLAIMEAFAAQLPVIATAIGGIPEIVIDNCTGRLFPAEDSEKLASLIDELMDDEQQRGRLGRQAYKLYREKFSIDQMTRKICNIYTAVTTPSS